MTTYWKRNGKYLKVGGKYAISENCCCGVLGCALPPDVPENLTITFTSTNANWDGQSFDLVWDGVKWFFQDLDALPCISSLGFEYKGVTITLNCGEQAGPYTIEVNWGGWFATGAAGSPTTNSLSPINLSGSVSAEAFDGTCGGATTLNYDIVETP